MEGRAGRLVASRSRVVAVTGVGLITPLGNGATNCWRRLLAGDCAIRSTTVLGEPYVRLASRVAAWIDDDLLRPFLERERDAQRQPRFIQYALAATAEALQNANLDIQIGRAGEGTRATLARDQLIGDRMGVCVGTGMAPLEVIGEASQKLGEERGIRRISPYLIPHILPNMAAGQVSIKYGLRGALLSPSTACATGAHAIGDAFRLVQRGDVDLMVAGGTEAAINPLAMAGFCQARALSTAFNEDPPRSSRPFDLYRDGFVMSEGAGIVILEELERAKQRDAPILAIISGYGMSADAHHITAAHPDGLGAELAMRRALQDANLDPDQIDHVNAHATSTPLGDAAEERALQRVFARHPLPLPVTSNKGALGHLLGAAGAVESIFAILSLYHNLLPSTLNFTRGEAIQSNLDYLPTPPSLRTPQAPLKHVLKNSFGFGGTNASLCFSRFNP